MRNLTRSEERDLNPFWVGVELHVVGKRKIDVLAIRVMNKIGPYVEAEKVRDARAPKERL